MIEQFIFRVQAENVHNAFLTEEESCALTIERKISAVLLHSYLFLYVVYKSKFF